MLSILIPTYNYDAHRLVHDLNALAVREHVGHEIIIGNDCSTTHTDWMEAFATWPEVRIIQPTGTLGRAALRNLLAGEARGEWLLFIDCDAQVEADFSLSAYLQAARQAPVVCGGLRTPAVNPNPEATLRYRYERAADRKRSAQTRMKRPYHAFSTFNFLIQKSVFVQLGGFDRDCKEYGYEDALFGVQLAQHDVAILHIDNPLVHMGMDANADFLDKTETALRTLKGLHGRMNGCSSIENWASWVERLRLRPLIAATFRRCRPYLHRNLTGSNPSLLVFQLYKLGYFLSLT